MPVATRTVIVIGLTLLLAGGVPGAAAASSTDALWARVQAAVDELPRECFDGAAVVARVGTDPLDLFAWVRDETAWLPYEGALKGPVGTLLDRAGNALDRALLLHALLVVAGHEPQLVSGAMDAEHAARLAAAMGRRGVPLLDAPCGGAGHASDLAERAERELGADAAAIGRALAEAQRNRAELHETLRARTERHLDALALALERTDVPAPAGHHAPGDRAHWWVRLQSPGSVPLDLDPTLPDARPGDVLAAAATTHRIATLRDLATLDGPCPDLSCGDLLHTLVVRAVAEVASGRTFEEHVLLEHEVLPAEQFGVPLVLGVRATGGVRDLAPFDTVDPAAALRDALLEHDEWQPVLIVGADDIAARAVTAAGDVADAPGTRPAARAAGPLGGFGAIGGGRAAPAAPTGTFTALWWEFELRTPGAPARVERRAVFDLVGPPARGADDTAEPSLDDRTRLERALALVGHIELLVAPAAPTGELLSLWAASRLLAERDAWDTLHAHGLDAPMQLVNERLAALSAFIRPVDRLALERGRALRATGDAQVGLLVVLHHQALLSDLQREAGFDLIASAPTAPSPSHGTPDGWRTTLRAGVLDANLEALLAADVGPPPPGGSLADAFDRDPSAWQAVTDVESLDEIGALPPAIDARVRADLARGYVAVVPLEARDAVGWWRIDPFSGEAIGFGDRGWGQAMTGYAARANVALQLRGVLQQYASMGRCLGLAIVQPLRGIEGVGDDLAQCVFDAVCGALMSLAGEFANADENWTNVILINTIGALWGGVGEAGFGGVCGGLWERVAR